EARDEADPGSGRSDGPGDPAGALRDRSMGPRGRRQLERQPRLPQLHRAGAAVQPCLPPPAVLAGGLSGATATGLGRHDGGDARWPSPGRSPGGLLFGGGFGNGIGLMEIVIIAGLGWFALSYMRRRQAAAPSGYAMAGGGYAGPAPRDDAATTARYGSGTPAGGTPTLEMQAQLQRDCDRLRADQKINRLENIAVRSAEVTEAWQETGQDYVTVHFLASLLDYTTDESGARVLDGSRTEPVKFEEYWTFV